ncbi:MAG TPA: hypothetical protein ENJ61_00220 [Aquifex aeolicus]|uniref:Uncharacterized protein n=1 Tax=Aquifex aeolicus TaxID=63363 RepID=A0A7C5L940_AQUAO|nr:hypothetical protein [Aquifex aeolicus]
MKVADVDKRVEQLKNFLSEKGIKVKDVVVSDFGEEGILVRVFTNLRSLKKARELELELVKKGIDTDEFTVIILPAH